MPQTFYVSQPDAEICFVTKNGAEQQAHVLERRSGEVYVHYVNTDKRMDEWVPESCVRIPDDVKIEPNQSGVPEQDTPAVNSHTNGTKKRKRSASIDCVHGHETRRLHGAQLVPSEIGGAVVPDDDPKTLKMSEEEYDIEHHKKITARRNFDKVIFGKWAIRTWYFSPYPLMDNEIESEASSTPGSGPSILSLATHQLPTSTGPRGHRTLPHSTSSRGPKASTKLHGRTSDLLAGGLGRERAHGPDGKDAESVLWVCDRCFKYMTEGAVWEGHCRKCTRRHPPGRKVYQRGAHIIWEVDGAKEKLYCQNLSLFGKLFIDIKTLFFDCDNFLFYILTDADSTRDHVLGFFSKEKVSYDDYNLACIVVLPPYQRMGYGMLMIEFSYELSRRAGKLGTPERPLSDLGLRSYLTYWVATIVRYLRRLLSVLPGDVKHLIAPPQSCDTSISSDDHQPGNIEAVDSVLSMLSPSVDDDLNPNPNGATRKKKKSTKGWDGEAVVLSREFTNIHDDSEGDPLMSARVMQSAANPDGSATTHVVVQCTLQDLAKATGLRVEDAAFALAECGLLRKRVTKRVEGSPEKEEPDQEVIVVSREMIETVARERHVKRMCMELKHVLL